MRSIGVTVSPLEVGLANVAKHLKVGPEQEYGDTSIRLGDLEPRVILWPLRCTSHDETSRDVASGRNVEKVGRHEFFASWCDRDASMKVHVYSRTAPNNADIAHGGTGGFRYLSVSLGVYNLEMAITSSPDFEMKRDIATTLHLSEQKVADLYAAHATEACRFAYLITGDQELARDLVHDAFIRSVSRFQHIRSSHLFATYLRRTVRNLYKNHLRRARIQRLFLEKQIPTERQHTMPDIEARDELWNALHRLPYRQRVAIVLRYYEDWPEQRAADFLECSLPALKSLTARGIAALRKELEGGG